MSGVIVNYNNNALTSMSSSGTKTLLTSGKYCEGDFEVVYSEPTTSSLTVTPTESQQTFDATGVYGYKPVTVNGDSNLIPKNIADGVSIFGVTGTHTGSVTPSEQYYKATLINGGDTAFRKYIKYNSKNYYQSGSTFYFKAGDTISYCGERTTGSYVYSDGIQIYSSTAMIWDYDYITPAHPLNIMFSSIGVCFNSPTISIDSNGIYDVTDYASASVNITNPSTSSLTVTPTETAQTFNATGVYGYKPVTVDAISSTYVGTGVSQRSSANTTFANATGTFTAPAGYYSAAATNTITTQAAQTIYPSTADQTIASYRWLTGAQTIKSVTTSNLSAENIAEGVVVKVGDATNASRITQVTGAHSGLGSEPYRCYIISNESPNLTTPRVKYGGKEYRSAGSNFLFNAGDSIELQARGAQGGGKIFIDGRTVSTSAYGTASYTYTPATNFDVLFSGYIEVELYVNTYTPTSEISGGGGFTADDIAMRSISGDISGNATNISSYAFYNCSSLTTASFPSATSIGSYAFAYCSALTTINFPSVTTIGASAFTYCPALTTASFPSATSIGSYAFSNCSALTTISFPSVTNIGTSAFVYCSALTTISFPRTISIGFSAFRGCTRLTTISFPNVRSIGTSAFYNCSSLTTASFPSATSIGSYAFYNCHLLTIASFPSATSIGNSVFGYCYSFLSLYLLGSSVPTLGTGAFVSTPIGGYTTSTGGVYGSIFVPSSLYNSYITATNWSLYSSRFASINNFTINYNGQTFDYYFEDGMTFSTFISTNYNNKYKPSYYFKSTYTSEVDFVDDSEGDMWAWAVRQNGASVYGTSSIINNGIYSAR